MRNVHILNPDGSLHRWTTLAEAERMLAKGDVVRATPRRAPVLKFRMVDRPGASSSKVSMPVITISDMRKIAGEQRLEFGKEEQDMERLIGFGLLPANVVYPANGYL